MKISKLIYVILAIPLAYFAYNAYITDGDNNLMVVPFLLGLAVTYIMSPYIDWQFANKYPPKVPQVFIDSIEKNNPFYRNLEQDQKQEFLKRISLIAMAKDFDTRPDHSVAYDVSHGLASAIATVGFYSNDYLMKDYEKIIIYKTSFPSPLFLEFHACEVNEEDKGVLIATDKMMLGLNKPQQYFNIALFTYAIIYQLTYPVAQRWSEPDDLVDKMCQVFGYKKEALELYIGLPIINPFALASTAYFMQRDKLQSLYPDICKSIDQVYRPNS